MNKNVLPNEIPDAYDAEGNLTVNSSALFMQDELAKEKYEEDEE